MRAEDLFEAMGGLDEELIARSERKVHSNTKEKRNRTNKKKRRNAEIYRFAVIAMSTAAVVFLFLLARDFIGPRKADSARSSQIVARDYEAETDSAGDALMAEEAAADEAAEAAVDKAAGGAANEAKEEAEITEEAEVAAEADVEDNEAEVTVEAEAEAEIKDAEEAAEIAAEAEEDLEEAEKTAVDLLGEYKGDYVALEYISAAEEAAGGSRIVPEYTAEGEAILTKAFEGGKATPEFLATTGEATYYVYLTKENGEVHKVTFYENAYVSMNNIPGVVMKISQEEYEDVMELFR